MSHPLFSSENRDQRVSSQRISEKAKKRKGEKSLMWQRMRELQAALRPLFSFAVVCRRNMSTPSKIEISGQPSANQRKKITCVTKVAPLTKKRKISW